MESGRRGSDFCGFGGTETNPTDGGGFLILPRLAIESTHSGKLLKWTRRKIRLSIAKGIEPNFVVPLAAGASPVFPDAEQAITVKQLQHSGDTQLLKAMELLH
jgi:hypothetical protein